MESVVKTSAQRELAKLFRREAHKAAGGDDQIKGKAEREKLPAFLREVAESLGKGRRSVPVEALIDEAMIRATHTWARFNRQDKTELDSGEVDRLTARHPDLGALTQKAYASALRKAGGDGALTLKPLAAGKLADMIEDKGTEWNDNNITNGGTTRIFAGKLALKGKAPSTAQLEALVKQMFSARVESEDAKLAAGARVSVKSGKLGNKAIDDTVKAAMKGYCYDPAAKDIQAELKADVRRVVGAVGGSTHVAYASASGAVKSVGIRVGLRR